MNKIFTTNTGKFRVNIFVRTHFINIQAKENVNRFVAGVAD